MSNKTPDLPSNVSVVVSRDPESAYTLAAQMIVDLSMEAVRSRGKFTVALSGGSTPKKLYELLASADWQRKFPWSKTDFFWGDERYVPSADPSSNFRMTREAMLSKVTLTPEQIHRVMTEKPDPAETAQLYDQEIRRVVPPGADGWPQFDLVLLGLGTNGHTASLFPYQPALHEKKRAVVSEYIEEVKMTRITLTAPVINASRSIVFVALGADKATVVREVVTGAFDPERLPAQLIRPAHGTLTWIVDPPAAAKLPPEIVRHEK